MDANRVVLRRLVDESIAAMNWGSWLETQPGQRRIPPFDRFEGMMLGLAVGDSLGNPSEGKNPGERLQMFGEVTDYPHGKTGLPSDDTQLSFWTLESILDHGLLEPAALSEAFRNKRIYGIGKTVREFLVNANNGLPWERRGVASAGNGALMRIAPVVFPHLSAPSAELWADTAIAAMITHNDSAAISSAVALTSILWECLHRDTAPAAEWWVEHYIRVAPGLETETRYLPRTPGALRKFKLTEFVAAHVMAAFDQRLSLLEAQRGWYSGAYLLETVPCVLYTLMLHATDPEQAIVRAVNDTRDNDTVAAIVGAIVGALYGRAALPARWIERLAGRTREDDDGKVFEVLERARTLYSAQ